MTRFLLIAIGCCLTACHSDPPSADPPPEGSAEEVVQVPAEPALPAGAELIVGEFEYVASHHGVEIRRAVRVADGAMTRLVDGLITSESPYVVIEDLPGRVTVEVTSAGRPPARRTFAFSDADHMVDVVTPELVFERTAAADEVDPAPADGSADGI